MIGILAPHPNTSVNRIDRALFVHRSWPPQTTRGWRWRSYRTFLVHYRANPRGFEYMLERASEFRDRFAPDASFDLLVLSEQDRELPDKHRTWIGRIWTASMEEHLIEERYDTIILLYPDAIGLGWGETERMLSRLKADQYLVVNGRRRVFILDRAGRRALVLRRFLAQSWYFEVLLAPLLLVISVIVTVSDALRMRIRN